jgi:hypothetical protein
MDTHKEKMTTTSAYVHTFFVSPKDAWRPFPIDMLRYEGCYFVREQDARAASYGWRGLWKEGSTIKLRKVWERKWSPSRRWQSYGWRVVTEARK